MFIFDYFRPFFVFLVKKLPFGNQHDQYPISRQRMRVELRYMFRWKALVISFSKIIKQFIKIKSKTLDPL